MITIKDIARSAGVSHTTVSRALRGDSRITPDTTERIRHLASEMGYVPNSIAQSLTAQHTFTIGMLVTSVADPVVMDFVEGVESVAQDHGYSIFISTSRNDPQREMSLVDTFQRRRVDGIIVTSSRVGDKYRSTLKRIQVPIVLINSQEVDDSLHVVDADSENGAILAVEHLLKLGHRRIGYVGDEERPLTNAKRLAGYRKALEKADIEVSPDWVCIPNADDDIQRGWLGQQHLMQEDVTAIFCHNDQIAIGVMNACYNKGIAVPQQLSIVGFDDIRAASYINPALTTIRQPLKKMGELAMAKLINIIENQQVDNEILDCELIERASTASPPSFSTSLQS